MDADLRVEAATRDQRAFHPSEHLHSALSSNGRVVITAGDSGTTGWAAIAGSKARYLICRRRFTLPCHGTAGLSPR
jgi:hypothetical protein